MVPTQPTRPALEALFLANLALIERVTEAISRRHTMSDSDAADFRAWAESRLIEDDYLVLRKFAGRSSIGTYLTVVLSNLFKDYRNARWGRWRPSAAAIRLGPLAIRLETLIYRDRCTFREAIETLKARSDTTEKDLTTLIGLIPSRVKAKEMSLEALSQDPTLESIDGPTDQGLWDDATRFEVDALEAAVRAALEGLPPEDRVIVKMRFWDGESVANIARTIGLDQKPLYRRLAQIQETLREYLVKAGLDKDKVLTLLAREVPE